MCIPVKDDIVAENWAKNWSGRACNSVQEDKINRVTAPNGPDETWQTQVSSLSRSRDILGENENLKWVTWYGHAHFRYGLSSVGWDLGLGYVQATYQIWNVYDDLQRSERQRQM